MQPDCNNTNHGKEDDDNDDGDDNDNDHSTPASSNQLQANCSEIVNEQSQSPLVSPHRSNNPTVLTVSLSICPSVAIPHGGIIHGRTKHGKLEHALVQIGC